MKNNFFILRFVLYTFIFLGVFNLSHSKTPGFNQNAKSISNYFSGTVSFDDLDYQSSQKFLKKLNNFESKSNNYSSKYLQSLINLEKFNEAYQYSKKLERKNNSVFESNLFLGLYQFKLKNFKESNSYFNNLEANFENQLIIDFLKITLKSWSKIADTKDIKDINSIASLHAGFNNLTAIQRIFAYCHVNSSNTEDEFLRVIENKKINFSRYNFFFANYLFNQNRKNEAIDFINISAQKYPGNLLIKQFKINLDQGEKNKNQFNCENSENILAEIFYVLANALSSQTDYKSSNFYINLAKFLNPNFLSYNTLLAENYRILKKNSSSKKIYKKLSKIGDTYRWYSAKEIIKIMKNEKEDNYINFLAETYRSINPDIYDTFDMANFLRTEEKYERSIELYSELLSKTSKDHKLYPALLERRGMAYERSENWELAEQDLINSLELLPDEPYVMNYLAYSWIEKNQNIEKALSMLRKANNLKKHDGYITDSLGWALYKVKNFSESKKYLELAIKLMPTDPVVNDHFADCLWMNNYKIQARYYWNNVTKSDTADEELKKKAEKKLLFGLEST